MTRKSENISVVMPVRNGLAYLGKSVATILENIEKDDEVIIVDDGSEDLGFQEIKNRIKDDERFRIIKNPKSGIVSALNLGVKEAANNWIARFDVDDEYPKTRLSDQRQILKDGLAAAFCDYTFFAKGYPSLGKISTAITSSAVPMSLYSTQRTPHPGSIFSKNVFIDVGGYREEDRFAEDLSLWLRMTRNGKLVSIPKPLLRYRITGNSTMGKNRNEAVVNGRKILREIGLPSSSVQECIENIQVTFETYDQDSDSDNRKLLLLRDLIIYNQINRKGEIGYAYLTKLAIQLARHPGVYSAGIVDLREKRLRAKVRKST